MDLCINTCPAESPRETSVKENCWGRVHRALGLEVYLRLYWCWSVSRVLGSPFLQKVLSVSLMELSMKHQRDRERVTLSPSEDSPLSNCLKSYWLLEAPRTFSVWSFHTVCNPLTELRDPLVCCFLMWLVVLIVVCMCEGGHLNNGMAQQWTWKRRKEIHGCILIFS